MILKRPEQITLFATEMLTLIENDPYAQRVSTKCEHSPPLSYGQLKDATLPQAFFKPIHWLNESLHSPSLWVSDRVGYGMMHTLDWYDWKILEPQLSLEMQEVGRQLFDFYLAKLSDCD